MNPFQKLFGIILICSSVSIACGQNINWRGTIASYDGKSLGVNLRNGQTILIDLPEALPISTTEPFSMADIKPGMVLGVTTVNRADGSKVAIDVRPISATAPQGLSAYDLQPQSTMTNAVLEATVLNAETHELVLNYKTGSVKVLVPPGTPMSRSSPGSRSDLVTGQSVYVASKPNSANGFTAVRVQVGKNGINPTQ